MRWGLRNYWVNMRAKHSWVVGLVAITFAFAPRSFAAPPRVVSTFLCTDEYVFRMVPHDNIAALSFLAADTHPVVSTIRDRVKGMTLIRPDTETVLNLKPDLVVIYEGTNPRLHAHLKEIGTPKFWPRKTLEPMIAQYKKDHPAPPVQPLPMCKGP